MSAHSARKRTRTRTRRQNTCTYGGFPPPAATVENATILEPATHAIEHKHMTPRVPRAQHDGERPLAPASAHRQAAHQSS